MGKIVAALGFVVLLSSCTQPDFCKVLRPIYPTQGDVEVISDGLADQILANNRLWDRHCTE